MLCLFFVVDYFTVYLKVSRKLNHEEFVSF